MNNIKVIFILSISISILSCTMRQEIFLEKDGSGKLDFTVEMAPYLGEVIEQVQTLMDETISDTGEGFFNLEEIRKGFSKNKNVEVSSLESPHDLRLEGSLKFNTIESILQNMEKEGSAGIKLVSFAKKKDTFRFDLNINRNGIQALLKENEDFNNPLIEHFGPGSTEGLSSSDYLDMMEFAMGNESRQGIMDSRLTIIIHVKGKITDQKGGYLLDKSSACFELSLLDLVMLENPLAYSLTYK